jgi:L-seryl-tRNA(Ser) seleniumtransferase
MKTETRNMLREIPAVHLIVNDEDMQKWRIEAGIPEELFSQVTKETVQHLRSQILDGLITEISFFSVCSRIKDKLIKSNERHLQRVFNGTGIVLHTNLGRAVLAEEAIEQVIEVAKGYNNLEYRLEEGVRGSRHDHIEDLIKRLTGAEAAMVVNNNAAAVFLVLRELASGKEAIVSRGQLVEIGGSFRISEIMRESGATLREVGTTNKTHLRDYEQAINAETALLMKVHTSNFSMVGFTKSVSIDELVQLGDKQGIPVYEDLGSGLLYNLEKHHIGREPVISDSIRQGIDLVSFSGDKLLGGPQAGIIAGRKKWIDRLKKNQLARVLRVDKMTLAALEATLRLYLDPKMAVEQIPTLRDILMPVEQVRAKAEYFQSFMKDANVNVEIRMDQTEVGGGSLPDVVLPTAVAVLQHPYVPAHVLERKLREGTPAIIGRIAKDEYILDFRTISRDEIPELAETIKKASSN